MESARPNSGGVDFDQAWGESRRAVGLNPAGRQDGSAGGIGVRGGRKWG